METAAFVAAHTTAGTRDSWRSGSVTPRASPGRSTCDVAEVIGRGLGVPTASLAPEDAGEHFA
ncbi:hypothetical protein [Streptomyces brasiliensis]|uniref:Uncharacterized protein n=1 Tax=Streptomyces brasiliensis TaxID=1954 RepID=A0A917KLJ2_9ACTN|nr:hypothetical protein [Streptomyces brasiliensis]GGJ16387.1 hypothetical protein GCM10010121_028920 [Streptomyces brasiliensis]